MKVISSRPTSRESRCTTTHLLAPVNTINCRYSSDWEGAHVVVQSIERAWGWVVLTRSCGEAASQKPAQEKCSSFSNNHPHQVSKEDSEVRRQHEQVLSPASKHLMPVPDGWLWAPSTASLHGQSMHRFPLPHLLWCLNKAELMLWSSLWSTDLYCLCLLSTLLFWSSWKLNYFWDIPCPHPICQKLLKSAKRCKSNYGKTHIGSKISPDTFPLETSLKPTVLYLLKQSPEVRFVIAVLLLLSIWQIFKTIFGRLYLVSTNQIGPTPSSRKQAIYEHFSQLLNGNNNYLPASDVVCVQTQTVVWRSYKHCFT